MKQIIIVSCNEEEFNIKIDGKNIDLLSGVVHLIKGISEASEMDIDFILSYINKYLKDEEKEQ